MKMNRTMRRLKGSSRALLLAVALTLVGLALAEADPWQVDTCYIFCDGGSYIVPGNSLESCCAGQGMYTCPDHTAPPLTEWSGGAGEFPTLCPPPA